MSSTQVCECDKMSDEEKRMLVAEMAEDYAKKKSSLIQVLHLAQGIYGYLPLEIQRIVADKMEIPLSEVSGVVSFYSIFTTQPKGRHIIQICLGTACYVRGGRKLVERLTEKLGIEVGQTTKDQRFSLQVMRCIGACGLAPAISIDGTVYKQVSPQKLDAILDRYE